jgi:hypothetical protein
MVLAAQMYLRIVLNDEWTIWLNMENTNSGLKRINTFDN